MKISGGVYFFENTLKNLTSNQVLGVVLVLESEGFSCATENKKIGQLCASLLILPNAQCFAKTESLDGEVVSSMV